MLMMAERKGQTVKRARVHHKARRIGKALLNKRGRSSRTDNNGLDHKSRLSARVKIGTEPNVPLSSLKRDLSSSSLPSPPLLPHVVCSERCAKLEPSIGPYLSSTDSCKEETKCVKDDIYGLALRVAKEEKQLHEVDMTLLCSEELGIPALNNADTSSVGEEQLMRWKAEDEGGGHTFDEVFKDTELFSGLAR